ncbi:hypothetical protein [Enterococcus faecium]|uniref:hypothetical protein n=2 Tax=Enterococcus TaxID=1350 RepID=UPI0011862672|nr:hypothetical protein [Enterococcus faecium]
MNEDIFNFSLSRAGATTFVHCNECKEAFTVGQFRKNDERCPSCGADSSEIYPWKQIRYWNESLPRYPKKGVKYSEFNKIKSI